jgi:cyclase
MLTKRIIPCLDIKDGKTVKGINFKNLIDAGDPVELARKYSLEGADELVFLDISATEERRETQVALVKKIAKNIQIPFTVGGGISSIDQAKKVLRAGADKVAINSAALNRPSLISDLSNQFGLQCIVVAIDAKQVNNEWYVYKNGGKLITQWKLFDWAKKVVELGAGEILFTSMNGDGTKSGFANSALAKLSSIVNVPIIASGGAGSIAHFKDAFEIGKADAALAASVFHFNEISIPQLKNELKQTNIPLR